MRLLSTIICLLVFLPVFSATSQSIGTPDRGAVIAEYRSAAGGTPLVVGIDLQTNAMFRISYDRNSIFKVSLVTPEEKIYTGTAGSSVFVPAEDRDLERASLSRPFPFLLPSLLGKLPEDAVQIEHNADGSTLHNCELISGSITMTINGLPEGFTSKAHQVQYRFSPNGRVLDITRQGNTDTLKYIERETPELAIPVSYDNGNWILHDFEIYPEGNTKSFTPDSVAFRARDMLVSYNQRMHARSQTPSAQKETARLISDMSKDQKPIYTKKWALIITGVLVIAVGSLAWWKNRS